MEKVISVDLMRKSDAYTIENFVDSKALMFKAGKGIFNSRRWTGRTAIVCGSGNNAGDGYVLALLLKEAGIESTLFLLNEKFSEDGKYYFNKCLEQNIPYTVCDENTDFDGYSEIADCIFGTGFRGEVRGIASVIIDKINESNAAVISVDINSGLNGDSGTAEKCVHSDLTVSIGYYKTGHFINQASEYIKSLVNCDIDITLIGESYYLAEKNECDVSDIKAYENCDDFSKQSGIEISKLELNPIKEICDFSKANGINVLVKNLGECSVLSKSGKTFIIKEQKKWLIP